MKKIMILASFLCLSAANLWAAEGKVDVEEDFYALVELIEDEADTATISARLAPYLNNRELALQLYNMDTSDAGVVGALTIWGLHKIAFQLIAKAEIVHILGCGNAMIDPILFAEENGKKGAADYLTTKSKSKPAVHAPDARSTSAFTNLSDADCDALSRDFNTGCAADFMTGAMQHLVLAN